MGGFLLPKIWFSCKSYIILHLALANYLAYAKLVFITTTQSNCYELNQRLSSQHWHRRIIGYWYDSSNGWRAVYQ